MQSNPFFWRVFKESEKAASRKAYFYHSNRIEVIALYRDLMKETSKAMPRKLERAAKLAELKFMFRAC